MQLHRATNWALYLISIATRSSGSTPIFFLTLFLLTWLLTFLPNDWPDFLTKLVNGWHAIKIVGPAPVYAFVLLRHANHPNAHTIKIQNHSMPTEYTAELPWGIKKTQWRLGAWRQYMSIWTPSQLELLKRNLIRQFYGATLRDADMLDPRSAA